MRFGRVLIGITFGAVLVGAAPVQQQPDARANAIHLLQRATFGVRPADVEQVLQLGREQWLDQQLRPSQVADAGTAKRLEKFPVLTADMGKMLSQYQMAQRERRQMAADSQEMRRRATPTQAQPTQQLLVELVNAKLTRAVYSERQLEEVMTDFWFNHFNVFFGKGIERFLVANYETNAIRPHVFGKFRDLLGATAKHPAMLFYLDNAQSVYVDTVRNPRTPQQMRTRGLNENYARELMELHTVGVDGGYTQMDVVAVARAFTGWQFTRPGVRAPGRGAQRDEGDKVEFVFRPMLHDNGEKVVLGHTLPAGRGIKDGEQVLDILARHPSTAQFIAKKLVERFVADDAPKIYVDEIAAVFTKTDGDLREVTRALFSSPRFYAANLQRSKIKTPFELVASALRATNAEVNTSRVIPLTLRTFGHLPYNEPAPTGFPAASGDWVNSGAMVNRMNFGLALAANRLDGVRISRDEYEVDGEGLRTMLQKLMPGVNTTKLETTIRTELAKPVAADTAAATAERMRGRDMRQNPLGAAPVRGKAARALGLALGAPEFQRK